jgi:hypothetical protein
MSDPGMRSGRGARLPGMGAPAGPASSPAAPKTDETAVRALATPQDPRASAQITAASAPREHRGGRAPDSSGARRARVADRDERQDQTTSTAPSYVPHAADMKIQVNPRVYRGIWRHYEQLVDELPRERRRGALTALVNAVLAQHAPRDVGEALNAIIWLRQAEASDAPADTPDQTA